jgi:hypothetical protein
MPRKTKEQNQIQFLFGDDTNSKLNVEAEKSETFHQKENDRVDQELLEQHKSKKLSNTDDGMVMRNSIRSAGYGGVAEDKSSSNFIGQTNSSVWGDKEAVETKKVVKDTSADNIAEILNAEKKASLKRESDKERMSNIPISGKGSVPKGTLSGLFSQDERKPYGHNVPSGNISIFDNSNDNAFGKLAEKTGGETLSENKQKVEKDESWKTDGKQKTTKSLFDNLFE